MAVEGPYGAFTTHARRRTKVALIAGGIGVTAVRSLLEDLPRDCDPVVILRASNTTSWCSSPRWPSSSATERAEFTSSLALEAVRMDRLAELVPDLLQRDVYVAGPESFVHRVVAVALRLGVPKDNVHFEVYSL